MFDYSICKDAYNIDKDTGRVYKTPNGEYPSITTILAATSDNTYLQRWRDKVGEEEANRISKEATDRGSSVHEYIEKFFLQDKETYKDFLVSSGLINEPTNIRGPAIEIIKECVKNKFTPYAQEVALWHPKLKYAGRVDGVGLWNNVLHIVDFKTSKKKKYASGIKNYYIQCTAYAVAHNYLFNTEINNFVVVIGGDQVPIQTFSGKVVNFIPELKNRILTFYRNK